MSKPIEIQYTYKKIIGFTQQQKAAFEKLEKYGININQFIRAATATKIKADWPQIKQSKNPKLPF